MAILEMQLATTLARLLFRSQQAERNVFGRWSLMLYFDDNHASIEEELCFLRRGSCIERMDQTCLRAQLFMKPKEGA